MNNILEIQNLAKIYTANNISVPVFENINLIIEKPKTIAIMGESGAGKTTLLNIIGLLDKPSNGNIIYQTTNMNAIKSKSQFRNQNIGFIFQNHFLLEEFTALENAALPLFLMTNDLESSKEKTKIILSEMGLNNRLNHRPGELSGGEKQRVAIARALSTKPSLILADEPTGNLDYKNRENVNQLLLNIHKKYKKTLILATHSETLASQCQEIYFLGKGQLKKIQKY